MVSFIPRPRKRAKNGRRSRSIVASRLPPLELHCKHFSLNKTHSNGTFLFANLFRLPVAMFWLAWTAKTSIHPITPIMSGLFFGLGYILIFMAMINYLTDAYKQYSASAQAAASTIRSTMAVCLPLATNPMYSQLGINWATSLLAFISLSLAIIPFVFMRYGEWIRGRSPFAQRVMKGDLVEDRARTDEMA